MSTIDNANPSIASSSSSDPTSYLSYIKTKLNGKCSSLVEDKKLSAKLLNQLRTLNEAIIHRSTLKSVASDSDEKFNEKKRRKRIQMLKRRILRNNTRLNGKLSDEKRNRKIVKRIDSINCETSPKSKNFFLKNRF